MDYATFTALALRIAGIVILASGVAAIPNTFGAMLTVRDFADHPTLTLLASALLASSGSLIVGLALVIFPATVANRMIEPDALIFQDARTYRELQTLAFSVLGLYFLCAGVFDAVYWYARSLYLQAMSGDVTSPMIRESLTDEYAGYVSAAMYVVGGVILLLGARVIANAVAWLRGPRRDDR